MSAAGKSFLPAGRGRFALVLSVQKQLALSRQLLAFREKGSFIAKPPLLLNWMSTRKGTSPPAGVLLLPTVVIEDSSVLR